MKFAHFFSIHDFEQLFLLFCLLFLHGVLFGHLGKSHFQGGNRGQTKKKVKKQQTKKQKQLFKVMDAEKWANFIFWGGGNVKKKQRCKKTAENSKNSCPH